MIAFRCPRCGVQLRTRDEMSGRTRKCPGCKQSVAAPGPSVPSAAGIPPSRGEETHGSFGHAGRSTMIAPADLQPRPDGPPEFAFLAPAQEPGELGRVGPYRVLGVLGAGAMGIVFHAEDPGLQRPVALKVLRPALAAREEERQRFLREARATAAVCHDNVVTIHQVGEEGGVPWFAMQLLQGECLEDRLREQGAWVAPAAILRIGQEAAEGLAAAHARRLVHHDVKPSNIWLEAGRDRVKLIDFGLAGPAGGPAHPNRHGILVGTPAYMAPEQTFGGAVDHRCDLFSLGCVLYRMGTGHLPFPGDDVHEIVQAVRTAAPRPPRAVSPTLPPDLADLILGLLAKAPGDRPHSARVVADALRRMRRDLAGETAGHRL